MDDLCCAPILAAPISEREAAEVAVVLKALAEQLDMTLGDLLEGMTLHCFEGKVPFGQPTLDKIAQLKSVYDLDLTASDSHNLEESGE